MNEWPALNSLAWLRLPCCGAEHPTRVEDFSEQDDITVGAPMAPHAVPVKPLEYDEAFFMGWVMGRGALEVPVVLVRTADEPVAMWTLKAVGEPIETQRRAFVRLTHEMSVELNLAEGSAPVKATTIDVSEGGLRCELGRWALDPGGRRFEVVLTMNDQEIPLQAEVAWWGNLDEAEKRIVGIRFVEIEEVTADRIRGFIFKTQIEQRRNRFQ